MSRLQALQKSNGFAQLRELRFVGFKFSRVNATSKPAHLDGVFEVEHFVIEQIFDCVSRAGRAIEDTADDDGVVSGIVVTEGSTRHSFAPGEFRAAKHVVKEPLVQ